MEQSSVADGRQYHGLYISIEEPYENLQLEDVQETSCPLFLNLVLISKKLFPPNDQYSLTFHFHHFRWKILYEKKCVVLSTAMLVKHLTLTTLREFST